MSRHVCPGPECGRCADRIAAAESEQMFGPDWSQRDLDHMADRASDAEERARDREWGY